MEEPTHSPLGASSAERWMNCPGSVALIKALDLPDSDSPDYRELGTAAHEAAAYCLKNNLDAWEVVGQKFNNFEVDVEMADAIQMYFDTVRPAMGKEGAKVYIEHGIRFKRDGDLVKEIVGQELMAKYFYGTGDHCVVFGRNMIVTDYKHGEGIVVEVKDNPQLMYYAFGFLQHHPEVEIVTMRIVQPRTFDEAIRTWVVEASYIKKWVAHHLVPAMQLTEMEGADLDAGSWCRFCPAKLICPLMVSLFGAACQSDPKQIEHLTDSGLGRSYAYREAVKFYIKALEDETYRRLNAGGHVPGTKLVQKKANRVFKEGAAKLFKDKFGYQAMTKPELLSPAEMSKLGAAASELVKEYAYTPQAGLTVAASDDKRVGVKMTTSDESFSEAVARLKEAAA